MTEVYLNKGQVVQIKDLIKASIELYEAGQWHCDRSVDEKKLWNALKDALSIK